jgi:hypothetical protein
VRNGADKLIIVFDRFVLSRGYILTRKQKINKTLNDNERSVTMHWALIRRVEEHDMLCSATLLLNAAESSLECYYWHALVQSKHAKVHDDRAAAALRLHLILMHYRCCTFSACFTFPLHYLPVDPLRAPCLLNSPLHSQCLSAALLAPFIFLHPSCPLLSHLLPAALVLQ